MSTTISQTPAPADSASSNPDTLKQRSSTEEKNRTGKGAVNLSAEASDKLQSRVKGEVVLPSHPGYDQARAIWNAMIERRPLRPPVALMDLSRILRSKENAPELERA